ncbi:sigma-54-dependent transcriptional regulator [Paracidobacterium acidisoli]|uniref:Sigma-54-dependent Fis family transcriptional regulator n=1 Tax=Paracidobacterium acidisoli TaxID=2303751 RepID=A0A372INU4_9BACT|nr:sigma-54 dependent transcriptional regulator [Paracidobacterium acidisoli]MBT9331902.1 sigma-54 dependent transcriptional regulator [Paracidobacterium acidisoli]
MSNKAEILIVDDEANTLATLARAFRLAGHEATVCDNAARALELALARPFDLILSDVVMPRRDGLALLDDLKSSGIAAPVVMMSGQAHIEMAVKATRLGALDFLEKPLSTDKLLLTVENALKLKRLETENKDLRRRVGRHEMVWTGETMRRVMSQIERVAASETRLCIYGETGTGKELVARTVHDRSSRAGGPFVTLNCGAVPAELIESELFGHEKGSFTGAAQRHVGRFEQAHHGTLFLDEIGDMPAAMQAKLLRVLEDCEVERIGADKSIHVDVRVLVATHRNLDELVEAGVFRRDLYHRVVVFPVQLPALRQRKEDIPVLVEHFVCQVCAQNGWKPVEFAAEATETLARYGWPGNIRELRNVVERLLLLADGVVDAAAVNLALPAAKTSPDRAAGEDSNSPLAERVAVFERSTVLAELERHHRHVTNTAKALGLERSHLYKKCQQLGIDLKAE